MRPFKPAPKNASANRIRERYLHQLGLQRGGSAPLAAPHDPSNHHVVVISGLPSLPEDRPTTEHIMESHDFSVSKQSQTVSATGGSSSNGDINDDMSDSGSVQGQIHTKVVPEDVQSHCSKSTLSVSPNIPTHSAGASLTVMALHYPTSLRKVPHPAEHMSMPPPSSNNNSNKLPSLLSHSAPWNCLSKPATVLLDSAEYQRGGGNDHDSVSSGGTQTTAESSLTTAHATMVSRDWGAIPHPSSAGVSVSSLGGESPASTPGVYFQCGHPRLLGGHVHVGPSVGCASTSSLAHALNRFNIDSDCEASVASNSLMEDHMMDEDDACSLDDTASRCSVASHTSTGSTKSQLSSASHGIRGPRKKKIGKTKRLMNRAAAHERILQIRSNQSQKMRANVVHSQRMSSSNSCHNQVSVSGLSTAMAHEVHPLSVSPGSTSSSQGQASIPLMHIQHGSDSGVAAPCCSAPLPQSMDDLGRTPTSSNCSNLRRQLQALGPPSQYLLSSMPAGVHQHLQGSSNHGARKGGAPLGFHPQLASRIPAPPPKLGAGMMMPPPPNVNVVSQANSMSVSKSISVPQTDQSIETKDSTSLQHLDHNHQATVDDVMEVAMTLSKLGGVRSTGSIPRMR